MGTDLVRLDGAHGILRGHGRSFPGSEQEGEGTQPGRRNAREAPA
jgi:hypothetical protein